MRSLVVLLRHVSRHELAARPFRSMLVAGAVAVGVALLVAMHVATESIVAGFGGDLEKLAGKADLQVLFGTGETPFSEELRDRVAAVAGVEQAAALVRGRVALVDGRREVVELFGVDLLQRDVAELYGVEVLERHADDHAIVDDPHAIFVTEVLAAERGLVLGSTLRVAGANGVQAMTVRGILASRGLASFLGGRMVAMFLPAAQPVLGRRGDLVASMVDQVDVRASPGFDLAGVEAAIAAMLGPGFGVTQPVQRRLLGEHVVSGLRATLVGMSTLALLAAVFIVHASVTTMVAQRLAAMATLVGMGARTAELRHAVVAEAALLGAVGAAAGVPLGLVLASFVGGDAAAGMGLNYSLAFDSARVAWRPEVVFLAHPLGGVLTAAASAWLPTRRLRSVSPVELQRDADALLHGSSLSTGTLVSIALVPAILGASMMAVGVPRSHAALVSAGGVLVIAAGLVASLPVLRLAWTCSTTLLPRLAGVPGRLAAENLVRTMDRSLVTASAIALSVAIAVGAGSLVQSFRSSVAGWYGFAGDAVVSSGSSGGGWLATPVEASLEGALAGIPGVDAVETLRVLQGQVVRGERVALAGLSAGLLRRAVEGGRLAEGRTLDAAVELLADGRALAVSENFVSHFGMPAVGEPALEVDSLNGPLRLPVVAVVPDYISDKGSVLLSRELLRTRWKDHLVNFLAVDLREGFSAEDLAAAIASSPLADGDLVAMPTREMIARVDGLIDEAFADIATIKLLVLFLTAVGVADLVLSNVLARRREMAVLRLVGMRRGDAIRMASLEGLAVSVAAAGGGAVVGGLCAWLWVRFNYPALVGYVLGLHVAWDSIAASLALAAGTAVLVAAAAAGQALNRDSLAGVRTD